jgi:signal transduction histidine kinase
MCYFFQSKHIKSQQLTIVKNYAVDLPDVLVIQDQISQVLLNLTINAADATPASGGTVTIKTWKTEESIFLSIADTGKGIDKNMQNNIFEPFFSTKREEDGTGLGLSTSYGIIKQHRGQLTFVSEPDKGTTFTLSPPESGSPQTFVICKFIHEK